MITSQRKKEASIIYHGDRAPIQVWHPQVDEEIQFVPKPLILKIIASPEDWRTLYHLAHADPEHLGRLIQIHIANYVYEERLKKGEMNQPRGIQAAAIFTEGARAQLMHEARKLAGAAYVVFRYWGKKPIEEWPGHFNVMVQEIEEEIEKLNLKKATEVTTAAAWIVEREFGERMDTLMIKRPLEAGTDFERIYLKDRYKKNAEGLFAHYKCSVSIEELGKVMP